MIRKNAVSLFLATVMALAILAGMPVSKATDSGPGVSNSHSSILTDEVVAATPTPGGASTDSGVSGGGNGG